MDFQIPCHDTDKRFAGLLGRRSELNSAQLRELAELFELYHNTAEAITCRQQASALDDSEALPALTSAVA